MAGIRISGMASGLPPNIVDQIMEAERIPMKQIETRKAGEDEKLKLVTDLETKVSEITKSIAELVGTRGFMNQKLISGSPDIINGTVDPNNAVTGTWNIEVLQLANKPGAISNGFPDKDRTETGVGYFKFKTPTGVKEVYLGKGNTTLNDLADAVNKANLGVRASIMDDRSDKETPYKLLISGLTSGDDKQVEFPTVYMLDGDRDFYFDKSRLAKNAKIKVDGFDVEVPENNVTGVVPGVTLDLKQIAPGREIPITVKEDMEAISGKVKTFVDSFNGVLGFIQAQHKLQKNKAGKEGLGPLGGDSLLRSIETRLRSLAQNPQYGVSSKVVRLSDIGIEFTRNGTLNFNQDRFNAKLNSDPTDIANFLRGDGFNVGFIPSLKREIGNLLNNGFGPISNRKRGVQSKIEQMDKQIANKERQLEKREDSLRKKFADLETTMSKINSQGAAIGAMAQGAKQG
jgi:flagellar hook-associated protein 2